MAVRYILVQPKKSANVGATARAIKNFGFTELYLVAPRCKLDADAYALASHAADVLDNVTICSSLEDAIAGCYHALGTTARPRKANELVYSLRQAATKYAAPKKARAKEDILALVFGPEDWGLSNQDLMKLQGYIVISTEDYASLNLAQAVQVVAYEWHIASQNADLAMSDDESEEIPRAKFEGMYNQLRDLLHLIGYTDAKREQSAMTLFRNIFDRANLNTRELSALRGLWRQVRWAAQQPPEKLPQNRLEPNKADTES